MYKSTHRSYSNPVLRSTFLRCALLVVYFFAAPGFASPISSETAPAPSPDEYKALSDAFLAAGEGRCAEALSVIPGAVERNTFWGYPGRVREMAIESILSCLRLQEPRNREKEFSYLQQLIDMGGPATPDRLQMLIWQSTTNGRPDIAVSAIKQLADFGEGELSKYPFEGVNALRRVLKGRSDGDELLFDLLRTLFEDNYVPFDPFDRPDIFMFDYAAMSIDRGDTSNAKRIVESLVDPGVILRVRIDRRFDFVREDIALADFFDLEKAADRYSEILRQLVESNSMYAKGYVVHARSLLGSWRIDEALAIIEPVALRIREPNANEFFFDMEQHKSWVLETYSTALLYQKYPEQSEDMIREATRIPDQGKPNVNQRVSYGVELLSSGATEKSLQTLNAAKQNDMNPVMRLSIESLKVCTKALLPEPLDYSSNLNYLVEHERLQPLSLTLALLCIDDMDAAARHLVQRLQDPSQRNDALFDLQHAENSLRSGRMNHEHVTLDDLSAEHMMWHRFEQLRQRNDVRRVIDQFGRIEVVPLYKIAWPKI